MSLLFLDTELLNVLGGTRKPWPEILNVPSNLPPSSPQGQTGVIKLNFLYLQCIFKYILAKNPIKCN